jgi:adenine-specific DNA-methyltransferase
MIETSTIKPRVNQKPKSVSIRTEGASEILYLGGLTAGEWINNVKEADRSGLVKAFLTRTIEAYWHSVQGSAKPLPSLFQKEPLPELDDAIARLGILIGEVTSGLPEMEAIYALGKLYTGLLPEATRTKAGVYYTPPGLTNRLLDMAESAGIKWATARVMDPACGGGAFLAPVCARIIPQLQGLRPTEIIKHIETHVIGWEIDPFGAWLSQLFVEIVLRRVLEKAGVRLKPIVQVCNSLEASMNDVRGKFDLVIGNPPFGKLKLTGGIRDRFKESLYGHPNLYGLFTHLATDLGAKDGVIALITPTSFLSGEYFKELRGLLRNRVQPIEMDFVSMRKGVFDGVLQETMLAAYQRKLSQRPTIRINELATLHNGTVVCRPIGSITLPDGPTEPWIVARSPEQLEPVNAMQTMRFRLKDWGYTVSTGPLVWNRHKTQLKKKAGQNHLPLVWAECIRQDGSFEYRAEKTNHQPYFKWKKGDDWLVVRKPCILLQRTTAKEQEKRLIAAALPSSFLRKGVVIENHLNMILPVNGKPLVAPEILSIFLNSKAANRAFKAVSGSVAISAYELESLPLPDPALLAELAIAVKMGCSKEKMEEICFQLYLQKR